jgi:Coenzyme PQQ synthesis protein D (PqqD)
MEPQAVGLFSQCEREHLAVEELPDGSIAIFDHRSGSVHSLNASAAAIWRACARGATLADLNTALANHWNTECAEGAAEAVAGMQELGLIVSDTVLPVAPPDASRRSMLASLAATLPVVLTMTAAEQKGYAQHAGSHVHFTTPIMTTFMRTTGTPSTTFATTFRPSTTFMRTTTSGPGLTTTRH